MEINNPCKNTQQELAEPNSSSHLLLSTHKAIEFTVSIFLILERKRESIQVGERDRGKESNSQAASMLCEEPEVGFDPTALGS